MNRLIIMIGIPGCGKSTYAKKLIKLHPDWVYISRDEVRYQYVADQAHYYDHEDEVYKEFCNRITMDLMKNKTVIADATHLTTGSRKKLINSLGIMPDEIIAVWVNTPFEECMKRNQAREGITRVPDKAMFEMKNRFRPPSVNEGYDRIVRVIGDNDSV